MSSRVNLACSLATIGLEAPAYLASGFDRAMHARNWWKGRHDLLDLLDAFFALLGQPVRSASNMFEASFERLPL